MKNSHLAKAFLAARDKLIAHAPEVATSWDYPRGGYRLGWVTDEEGRFAVRWLPKYGVVADGCTTNGYIDVLAWQCYPASCECYLGPPRGVRTRQSARQRPPSRTWLGTAGAAQLPRSTGSSPSA